MEYVEINDRFVVPVPEVNEEEETALKKFEEHPTYFNKFAHRWIKITHELSKYDLSNVPIIPNIVK